LSVKVIKSFPDLNDFNYNYKSWNRQFDQQNIILNGRYSHLYYPSHWTPLSLKFAFGGYEHYILGNMKYSVGNGSYLILNRDTVYESLIDSGSPVETLTLNFTTEFVNDVFYSSFNSDEYLLDYPELRDRHPVNFFQKLYPKDEVIGLYLNRLRKKISNCYADPGRLNELLHGILEHAFYTQLSASRETEQIASKKRSTRIELFNRLNRAKDYIRSNYSEQIDLQKLSSIACLCPHHFLRKFKSFFKTSPHQYLTTIRLEMAREMIEASNLSITEICMDSGYESLSSFSDLFKKRYGSSPENHRKKHSKKVNFQTI
jgi:AraC family transcriptional regulator